jgi:hypothetical protein
MPQEGVQPERGCANPGIEPCRSRAQSLLMRCHDLGRLILAGDCKTGRILGILNIKSRLSRFINRFMGNIDA